MKKQAKYKKGQKVYYLCTRNILDVVVQAGKVKAGKVKAVSSFGATGDYVYDIDDGTFIINYDREEFELYGTYKEAVRAVIAYYGSRIELLKELRSEWEKKLKKED